MLSFGVRCPAASVSSTGSTTHFRMDSARDTVALAASTARCTSASTAGFCDACSSVIAESWPLFASQTLSISGSSVMSAEMKGRRSPATTTCPTSGLARMGSSSAAGATFFPPAVTMISFLRPVIVR